MKQNPEMILSEVAGNHVLVPVGKTALNFNANVSLNEMGRTIWELLAEDMSVEKLVQALLAEYDVSAETAEADIQQFLDALREAHALNE